MSDFPDDRTNQGIGQPLDVPHHDTLERHLIEKIYGVPKTLPPGSTGLGVSPIPARMDHTHETGAGGLPVLKFIHPGNLTLTTSPNDWLDEKSANLTEIRSNAKTGTGVTFEVRKDGTAIATVTQDAGNKKTLVSPAVPFKAWTSAFPAASGTPNLIDCKITTTGSGSDLDVHLIFGKSDCAPDEFDRAELGPDWIDGYGQFGFIIGPSSIDNGAYVTVDSSSAPGTDGYIGNIRTVAEYPGDQFIEAEVGNWFQGHDPAMDEGYQWVEGEIYLMLQVDPDSPACLMAWVYAAVGHNAAEDINGWLEIDFVHIDETGTADWHTYGEIRPLTGWQSNPNWTVRFEADADGSCRAFVDGTLLNSDTMTPIANGKHIGIGAHWVTTMYVQPPTVPNPGTSLRIERVCLPIIS